MIRAHRKIHRLAWLFLAPLLLGLVLLFSRPDTGLTPLNDHVPELPGAAAGKGVLP